MKTIRYTLELLQSFLSDVLKSAFSISNYRKPVTISCPPLTSPPFKLRGDMSPRTSYGCAALGYNLTHPRNIQNASCWRSVARSHYFLSQARWINRW